MKEVKITTDKLSYSYNTYKVQENERGIEVYYCPNCENAGVERGDNYCCNCGIKIIWQLKKIEL